MLIRIMKDAVPKSSEPLKTLAMLCYVKAIEIFGDFVLLRVKV